MARCKPPGTAQLGRLAALLAEPAQREEHAVGGARLGLRLVPSLAAVEPGFGSSEKTESRGSTESDAAGSYASLACARHHTSGIFRRACLVDVEQQHVRRRLGDRERVGRALLVALGLLSGWTSSTVLCVRSYAF